MSRFLDDPAFSSNVFFPRPDHRPTPHGARDLRVEVDGATLVSGEPGPPTILHARVYEVPARPAVALVLFHGNGEIVSDYDDAAARFARAGARLAVVDFRGYGRSTGAPSLRALLADARPAVDALRPHLTHDGEALPVVVMGRSLGSVCAAEFARSLPDFVSGVVLESGFSDLVAFARRRGVRLSAVDEADLAVLCPLRKLAVCSAPLLVLHGAEDTLIAPEEARAAYAASGARDKRLVLVPGRGHNDLALHPLYWDELGAFIARVARGVTSRASRGTSSGRP